MKLPPVPVIRRTRAFPTVGPRLIHPQDPFPSRVMIAEAFTGANGRAVCGTYLGNGPGLDDVRGRFLGPEPPSGLIIPGPGPLRDLDGFLDRVLWRPAYESRFGFVAWDQAALFASLAHSFRKHGAWAVIFTDPDPDGGRYIDYYRSPIAMKPKSNGRISVSFGPRKHPDARDINERGRQWAGRFCSVRDAASAVIGADVDDLAAACRIFDIKSPPTGPASIESLWIRVHALRELYRAVRHEVELWP